ncbi:transglutaminase-like domain-containing protein [Candidatus Omnitrophota bacterium]
MLIREPSKRAKSEDALKKAIVLRALLYSIILFLFAFNHTPLLASEIYKSKGALVSKEGRRLSNNAFINKKTYQANHALVSKEKPNFNVGNFIIRKQTYRSGAALVSRPVEIDMIALNMLKANNIKSLEDYAQWLRENVKYKKDKFGDIWALPKETIERKYGDCEDLAFLNASILRVLGYKPKVLAMGNIRVLAGRFITSHAICVFEKDSHYLWFDNAKLKKTNVSSLEEFSRNIFSKYHCSSISEIVFDTKEWVTLFTKSDLMQD